MKKILLLLFFITLASCISTKNTIKNIDNDAPIPLLKNDDSFVVTQYSKDKKYGYDADYPINVFFRNSKDESRNIERFLRALSGPNNQEITFSKLESCCPFPTKGNSIGAGYIDVYEVRWSGQKKPVKLYFNIFEKGQLLVPIGFTTKKVEFKD